MKKSFISWIVLFVFSILIIESCVDSSSTKEPFLTTKSHYFGNACVNCHIKDGAAKSIFTVSGSVLDEKRKGINNKCYVQLYTEPYSKGKLVATIYTDESGNFYSTENIDFSKGLYPTLKGTPGVKEDTKHMRLPIMNGQCTNCHGSMTEKLGID